MRLFISINFDNSTIDNILSVQSRLSDYAHNRGNFTRPENLHLTLAFLGEVPADQIDTVKQAMDALTVHDMKLNFNHIGCFRKDSELWWIGIDNNPTLTGLQRALIRNLKEVGLRPDDKKFRPHITLARELHVGQLSTEDLLAKPFDTSAHAISLMVSERINGKLTYTEIYRR